MFRLTRFNDALFGQCGGWAGIDTGATGNTFGIHKGFGLTGNSLWNSKPRPSMVRAKVPCTSSQARTQREQTMHLDGSKVKYGLDSSFSATRWFSPFKAVTHRPQAQFAGSVLQFAVAIGWTGQAVKWMVGDIQLHHIAPQLGNFRQTWVRTCIPASTVVVQEGRETTATFDFYQTDAAGAKGFELVCGAEARNLYTRSRRRHALLEVP